jgi:hypothetical protein
VTGLRPELEGTEIVCYNVYVYLHTHTHAEISVYQGFNAEINFEGLSNRFSTVKHEIVLINIK